MKQMGKIGRTILIIALLCTFITTASAYELTYQAAPDFTATGIETIETTSVNPWILQEDGSLKSGNSGILSSVSALKVTVTGSGVLSFQYKVSSPLMTGDKNPNNLPEEDVPDSLLISAGTEVTTDIFYPEFSGQRYYGEIDWQTGVVSVNAENGQQTDIFFGFIKDGNSTNGISDCAWIKNLSFSDQTVTVNPVHTYNGAYGTVTATTAEGTAVDPAEGVAIGQTLTLSAAPTAEGSFYGWVRHYQTSSGTPLRAFSGTGDLTVNVNETTQYEPVFAPAGAYSVRSGCDFYEDGTDLGIILANAANCDVVLLKDAALSGDATVKSGVTLYVPFRSDWLDAEKNDAFHIQGSSGALADLSKAFVTLTINNGATLMVNGTLCSGAVMSGGNIDGMQGQTSGAFGRIANNGAIVIGNRGVFTTWGITDGSGTVTVRSGGTAKEPFIVSDFSGGSNTSALFSASQLPFKRYSVQNIRCELAFEKGGVLVGLCNLFAGGGPNEMEVSVMGTSDALFAPNETAEEGSVILRRSCGTESVITDSTITGSNGIVKTTWTITGGLTFQDMTLSFLGISMSTTGIDFPIPYNMELRLEKGTYNIPGGMKIMPGARVTVGADAMLNLTGRLFAMDGLKQGPMSGDRYPSTEILTAAGLSPVGSLVVDGTLNVAAGATLGGVIQTSGTTGKLIIAEGAYLTNSGDLASLDPALELDSQTGYQANDWVQQDGGKGAYSDNTSWFNLPARVGVRDESGTVSLAQLLPGVYSAGGNQALHTDGYTMVWCSNGSTINTTGCDYLVRGRAMATDTVAINSEACWQGTWSNSTSNVAVTTMLPATGYEGIDVGVTPIQNDDGSTTLTIGVTETATGESPAREYVHLVQWSGADGVVTTVRQSENGIYLIPAEAINVTVQSAMLGDVSMNGKLAMNDIFKLLSLLSTSDEFTILVGDLSANGKLAMNDIFKLLNSIS